MGSRYSRSNKSRYRRRRQRLGLAAFSSLVLIMLGGLVLFGVEPYQRTSGEDEVVQRSESPTVSEAPDAVNVSNEIPREEAQNQQDSGSDQSSGSSTKDGDGAESASGDSEEQAEKEEPAEPKIIATPDIPYNATEEEAKEMLEKNNLELGEVKNEYNSDYDKGGVFYQDPLPDVEIKEGSKVGITLSKGPEPESELENNPPDPDTQDLYLTVPKMGLYDDYVVNSADEASMMNGAGKITETGFPWQPSANTYIASHVYGYQGTGSWQHFALLPSMTYGDEVILSDSAGTTYTYEVTNIVTVMPSDTWITEPVAGKDMVSLQTCVGPGWSERMVVQAERVDVSTA